MEHLDMKVGPYTLVSKIGDGGMAEVFKARVERAGGFEKLVALKKILPNLTSNEKFRRNFINEARICGQLHHHNIVEVYDFLQDGTDLYLAMEFIDGLNLEEVFAYHRQVEQPLTSDVIMSLLVQVIEGLDYAHKAANPIDNQPLNVIHRDLKPSNILIDAEGVVKIVDFGVAKAANRQYETQEMTAKGTASYMSPEQLLGDRPVTQAADIFSVGTIFYEMLTLQRMFDGEHVFAILKQVATMDIDDHLNRTITGGDRKFLNILRKALAREPEDRYHTAAEMLRDLLSLHLVGHSPRRLADHLRKIRNVSESVEDARTRLVTGSDIDEYLDQTEDEAVRPTRVISEHELDEDEEDMETMLASEPAVPARPASRPPSSPSLPVSPSPVSPAPRATIPAMPADMPSIFQPAESPSYKATSSDSRSGTPNPTLPNPAKEQEPNAPVTGTLVVPFAPIQEPSSSWILPLAIGAGVGLVIILAIGWL